MILIYEKILSLLRIKIKERREHDKTTICFVATKEHNKVE